MRTDWSGMYGPWRARDHAVVVERIKLQLFQGLSAATRAAEK
jgi:hypothetical protein